MSQYVTPGKWHSFGDAVPQVPEDAVLTVENGFLSSLGQGVFHPTGARPVSWHTGAAYLSNGRLISHSRRLGGISGDFLHSLDQEYFPPPIGLKRRLEGSYYYAGPWMRHFGHFLLETIPTLWAYPGEGSVVFHRLGGASNDSVKLEMLRLLGVEVHPEFVTSLSQVEKMLVPTRPVALNAWCTPMAAQVWGKMGARVESESWPRGPLGDRVWLSRSRIESSGTPGRKIGHEEMDDRFENLGFDVVYPESLSFGEQVSIVRRSSMIAGFEGSALHLSAFALPGTQVLMLGSRDRPLGNHAQLTIDRAVGNCVAVVENSSLDKMLQAVKQLMAY